MSDLKNKTNTIITNEKDDVKETGGKKRLEQLLAKANTLPKSSGCYFMRGRLGEVIYVGKAKNLKARVSSYFNQSAKSPKTQILVSHIRDFDFILTNSDAESFVLENNLIKEHNPKYNIRLKDDKSYPYVSINYNEQFPRLEYVRRPKRKKKVELFGPYPVGFNISRILKTLTKAYQLRDCSLHEFNSRKEPCILYQMKQCSAPCVEKITQQQYLKNLRMATQVFQGRRKQRESLEALTKKMMEYAEQEQFEQAALLRDAIEELDDFVQKSFDQDVENLNENNVDVISFYPGEEEVDISIYLIRQGSLLGHKNFHFLNADLLDEIEEEVKLAILQYYSNSQDVIPEKIIINFSTQKTKDFAAALEKILGAGVKTKVFGRTKKYQALIDATTRHAEESGRVRVQNQDSVFVGLNKLKDLLNLKERPKTLECYDVAVWQGKSPTASQIVFYEGKPEKQMYRYYHLQELPEGNNDFAMMTEVFSRRLKAGNYPDVFIVDGGVQQVNTVSKVLEQMEVNVPVVGIAKARDLKKAGFRTGETKMSEERLVIPGRANPYILNKCPALMRVVVQMRDEAHRFSRKLHHKAEKKRVIQSWVDDVKGLNQKVREHILQVNTLSVDELAKMNMNELQNFLGLEIRHARLLYQYLHAEEKL